MPISAERLKLINWNVTVARFGYTDVSELNNKSRVVLNCSACSRPDIEITVISMRVRSAQRKQGMITYVPTCHSCYCKSNWANNVGFRQKQSKVQSDRMVEVWGRPGYRENQSEKQAALTTERWTKSEFRDRVVASITARHAADPEYRVKSLAALRTEEAVAKRLKITGTPEHRQKVLEILTRPDMIEVASNRTKELWQDVGYREKLMMILADPEVRAKISVSSNRSWSRQEFRDQMCQMARDRWDDPTFRQKMAQARANQPRISSIQKALYTLLGDLKVDFCEEGPDTTIGYYVFDCVINTVSGKKILIECQGDYWHSLPKVIGRDRSKFTYVDRYFPEYEIMYIWEHEFGISGRVTDRLKLKLGIDIPTNDFNLKDVEVREITRADEVCEFLNAYHYIGKGRGGKSYGAYHNGELIGAAVYSPQLRQNTAGQFGVESDDLRELSRFCIHPSYHKKNFASWFISQTARRVDSEVVVAYADTTVGHTGTIYSASGFKLHHEVAPDYWYVGPEGFVMHKRTLYGRARRAEMTEREYAEENSYTKRWGGIKNCFVRHMGKK